VEDKVKFISKNKKGNMPLIVGTLLILLILAFSGVFTLPNITNFLSKEYIDQTSLSPNPIINNNIRDVEYSIIIKNPPEKNHHYFRPQIEIQYEENFFETNNWDVSRGYKISLDSLEPGERDVYFIKFTFDPNIPSGKYAFKVLVYDSSGNLLESKEDTLNVKN